MNEERTDIPESRIIFADLTGFNHVNKDYWVFRRRKWKIFWFRRLFFELVVSSFILMRNFWRQKKYRIQQITKSTQFDRVGLKWLQFKCFLKYHFAFTVTEFVGSFNRVYSFHKKNIQNVQRDSKFYELWSRFPPSPRISFAFKDIYRCIIWSIACSYCGNLKMVEKLSSRFISHL